MSFFSKFFDKLADQETDEFLKVVHSLYGPIGELSLIIPTYKRGKLFMTLSLAATYSVILFGHVTLLAISCWKEMFNLENFSMSLHYLLIIALCIEFPIVVNSQRSLLIQNHLAVARPFSNYDTNIYEEPKVKKIRKKFRQQLLQFMWLPTVTIIVVCMSMWGPFIRHFGEKRYSENGVSLNLLFPCYYPFPSDEGILHLVTIGLQLMTLSVCSLVVIAGLLTYVQQSQCLRFEFLVACYALDTVFPRAIRIYKTQYPESDQDRIDELDPLFQRCVGICLKSIVVHHQNILQLGNGFDKIGCWTVAMGFLVGVASIGLSLINFLMALKSSNYEAITTFALLGIGESLTMLILCSIGEAITEDAVKFRDALYLMEWQRLNKPNRRTILSMLIGALKPYSMTAGKIVPVNHDTFSSIMNSAYSFFNLINAGLENQE